MAELGEELEPEVLDKTLGPTIKSWHMGDGGMHFELDDGRTIVFVGSPIFVYLYEPEEQCLH